LALLLPSEKPQQQLQLLAHIAGLLSDARFREEVAQADDAQAIASLFVRGSPR
jgi:mannitol/fructose-specific phosphotransferase system IIA component (Ntr-type)